MHVHQDLMDDFDWEGKTKQHACRILRVWTKMKNILKDFKKILRFFDQNLYGKLSFSEFFPKYFLEF